MSLLIGIMALGIYIILMAVAILMIARRLDLYGGIYSIARNIGRTGSRRIKRFVGDFILQGRFFRWGGEPVIEGIFRGVALYSYVLIMIFSLVYVIISIVSQKKEFLAILSTINTVLGFIALVAGGIIIYEMRPRKVGRSWLLDINGLDLLFLLLIPILGLVAVLGIYSEIAIYVGLAISPLLIILTPITRFWYNVASALNFLLRDERIPGKLPTPYRLDQLDEASLEKLRVGLGYFKDIGVTDLINLDSCANCGLCDSVCPAYAVERPLSPRQVVLTLRMGFKETPDKQVIDLLSDDVFWACTTCSACVQICPMGVDHVPFIVDVRRWLVYNMKIDQKKISLITNIANNGNSIGSPNIGRHEWIRKLGVNTAEETSEYDYLLWVGCMGSFDERARRVIEAFIDLLTEAGLRIAVLGDLETCCGDPLRRLGEESRFQDIALRNIELFKRLGVRRIVTICPHGYNVFKNEYRDLDPSFDAEILHHTELLSRLVDEGRLRLRKRIDKPITLHDSCYIARINGVIEEPRRVLRISSSSFKEARRSGVRTFCCGAGGANYWYDVSERKRISVERAEELLSLGAGVIAAECPFCIAMLEDALRNLGRDRDVEVRDISEILGLGVKG